MKLTELYDGHVLTLLEDAEDWNKEECLDVLSRSTDTLVGTQGMFEKF